MRYGRSIRSGLAGLVLSLTASLSAWAEPSGRDVIAPLIVPPMELGEPLNDEGVWQLLNSGGAEAGYVFETEPMAPLPGFSGAPINVLVVLDLDGQFLDVQLISHNEPIFVSGLGEAPFHKFFEQYRGHSISDSLASTANFLRAKGWQPGQPYQEGTRNFRVLNEWNAATVYQQAIALSAARIDG